MNIGIICGSNRAESGSRKVADYMADYLEAKGIETDVFDMHEMDVPMWSEAIGDAASTQAQEWGEYRSRLVQLDALVCIAAEWNGTIPPALHNFIMHLDRGAVGHKPAMLVGVSAGINGAYPIAELKASSNKNNRMVLVPDHVIVRNVNQNFDTGDYPIGPRIKASLDALAVYATHMASVRKDLQFDYEQFAHGM